jgi:hypothetical protein
LPALLRHMSVLISLASGSAAEAAAFGVPAIFLIDDARGPFSALIEKGLATVVDVPEIADAITRTPKTPLRPLTAGTPDIDGTVASLERIAEDYAKLCAGNERSR